jgi:glycosyltransferase involved in cell wall biosynthesis
MKVCFLAPEFLPIVGGVGTYTTELIKNLPSDIEVFVIAVKRMNNNSNCSFNTAEIEKYFNKRVKIFYITEAKDDFLYNAQFQLACLKWVPRIAKIEGIDLFHSHFGHMPDLFIKIFKNRFPSITTAHLTISGLAEGIKMSGIKFGDLESAGRYTIAISSISRIIEKIYLSKTPHIISVSNWLNNILINEYQVDPSLTRVIHNGVDPQLFKPDYNKVFNNIHEPIVLFTGRFTSTKGINYLVRAIPKILAQTKEVHFVFAGSGDFTPYLKSLKDLGVPSKFYTIFGYIKDYQAMARLYSKASIYVAPTLYENFPIRILEAMSCELPVIASNVCAIPEAIVDGENGILIPPKNIEVLIEKILYLLQDETTAKRFGKEARKTILNKFDWKYIARKTSDYYKEIIEESTN